MNKKTNFSYFTRHVKSLGKDKENNYLIIMNPSLILGGKAVIAEDGLQLQFSKDAVDLVEKPPKNVKYLFYTPKMNIIQCWRIPHGLNLLLQIL